MGDLLVYFYQLDASKESHATPDWEKFVIAQARVSLKTGSLCGGTTGESTCLHRVEFGVLGLSSCF